MNRRPWQVLIQPRAGRRWRPLYTGDDGALAGQLFAAIRDTSPSHRAVLQYEESTVNVGLCCRANQPQQPRGGRQK